MRLGTAILAMCVAALAAAAPAYAAVRYSERSDRTVDAGGIRTVEIDNSRGDIQVAPSADGRIHVTALKTCRGRDRAEAQRFAAAIGVTSTTEGDRWVLRVNYPKRVDIRVNFWDLISGHSDSDDFGQSHEVKLLVEAPPALALRLHAVSGDLAARGMSGPQRLRTTSGDCTVEAAGAAVDLETVSGDVHLGGARRAVVRTTSGDISVSTSGPLDARSVSGDIQVASASDTVTLATTSGEISADLGTPLQRADASSTSGDITLGLLGSLGASLELSTQSGDIECDVPVTLLGHGRQYMNAKYGRGGAAVKAHTVSGDLHVTSGGQ